MLNGIEGIRTLYEDILRTGLPLSVFPSKHSHTGDDLEDEVQHWVKKMSQAGITTRTLYNSAVKHLVSMDTLLDRKRKSIDIRFASLANTAQIMIYGDNVVLRTFKDGSIIALITHSDIALSLQSIFDLTWQQATPSDLELNS